MWRLEIVGDVAMRGDPGVVQDAFSEVRECPVGCLYTELAIHIGFKGHLV